MKKVLASLFLVLSLNACIQNGKNSQNDTPTQGKIHIAVDEAFAPIIAAEINAFQGLYNRAFVIPHYVSEKKAFELLLADSVRLVISGRDFLESEKDHFRKLTITPKSLKIAVDAVGVILHPENPDTLLPMSTLRSILTSSALKWSDLSGKGKKFRPVLVLDKEGSSNQITLLQKLGLNKQDIKIETVFAGGDREVINYVNSHPESIGFMGVNWISDSDDPTQMRFKNGIRVAGLMPDSVEELLKVKPEEHKDDYFQPLQAYLAKGFYPLSRDMMVCSREAKSGLGTGFIAWLASDKGQRVVLKAGLLPATMPVRIVKIKKDNDLTN